MKPFASPHEPSGETLLVDVGRTLLETAEGVRQLPKADWQPSVLEQYVSVLPQYPYKEQQLPKVEPRHVWPVVPPQAPLGETIKLAVGLLALEDAEETELAVEGVVVEGSKDSDEQASVVPADTVLVTVSILPEDTVSVIVDV
jgi:hypothetical protein